MLKHIKPQQVRLGMFIESVNGDWNGQRFWRSRFLLDCPKDTEALRSSDADDIVIKINVGADVSAQPRRDSARRTAYGVQLAQALQTLERSKPLIRTMFEDARMGECVPGGKAIHVVDKIAGCMKDSARALVAISRLKTRDEHSFLHSIAVTALMVHLGRSIEADDDTIQVLGLGGLLHDVGKIKDATQNFEQNRSSD